MSDSVNNVSSSSDSTTQNCENTNYVILIMESVGQIMQEKYGPMLTGIADIAGQIGNLSTYVAALSNFISAIEQDFDQLDDPNSTHNDTGWDNSGIQSATDDFILAFNALFNTSYDGELYPGGGTCSDYTITYDGATYYAIPTSNGTGYTWEQFDSEADAEAAGYDPNAGMTVIGSYEYSRTQMAITKKGPGDGTPPDNLDGLYNSSNDIIVEDLSGLYTLCASEAPDGASSDQNFATLIESMEGEAMIDVEYGDGAAGGIDFDAIHGSADNADYYFEMGIANMLSDWEDNPSSSFLTQFSSQISAVEGAFQTGQTELNTMESATMSSYSTILNAVKAIDNTYLKGQNIVINNYKSQ